MPGACHGTPTLTRGAGASRAGQRRGPYAGLVPDIGVVWVDAGSGVAEQAGPADLAALLERDDGWVWVDVPEPDESTTRLLIERFGIHPKAANDALSRNHIARLHHYGYVLYLALHRPEPGSGGHVHYLELDLFVGPRFVVTLHGPRNPVVPLAAMVRETGEVAARMAAGRLRPRTPMALVYAHVSALTNVQERLVNDFAARWACSSSGSWRVQTTRTRRSSSTSSSRCGTPCSRCAPWRRKVRR